MHAPGPQPRWSVELSARIVGQQDRVATSLLERPTAGFTVWDIRTFWQASDRLLFVAGAENFTDRNFREYLDFRPLGPAALQVFQPGVNFYFGSELVY